MLRPENSVNAESVHFVGGAQQGTRYAKKRIEDLNFSIQLFEKNEATGEPWPGSAFGVTKNKSDTGQGTECRQVNAILRSGNLAATTQLLELVSYCAVSL